MSQLERGREIDQRFGVTQQQVPPRPELLLEHLDHLPLALGVEVDHDVSAQDHVHHTEQGHLPCVQQVQVNEVDVLLDLVGDLPTAILLLEVAIAKYPLGLAEGALPIDLLARPLQHSQGDVGGVHAQIPAGIHAGLPGEDHDAVRLLAAGTASGPDVDGRATSVTL